MTEDASYTQALIQYRMERAFQTLNAAQLLREQNADTASIVNRAYYAMFYAALALLATIGEETSKHGGANISSRPVFCQKKWGNFYTQLSMCVK